MSFSRLLGALSAIGLLMAACGDGSTTTGPTDGVASPTEPRQLSGQATLSGPLEPGIGSPALISTPSSVVVAGGVRGSRAEFEGVQPTEVISTVHRLDRDAGTWSQAPSLPDGLRAFGGTAVGEDLYLNVGDVTCGSPRTEASPDGTCRENELLVLEDGADRWQRVSLPDDVPVGLELGTPGRVGEDHVALPLSGHPDQTLAVLDPDEGTWTMVGPPPDTPGSLGVGGCFTEGIFYGVARTDSSVPDLGAGDEDLSRDELRQRSVEPYAYRAWSFTGDGWSESVDIDLGTATPRLDSGGSQLCGSGRFAAYNDGTMATISLAEDGSLARTSVAVPSDLRLRSPGSQAAGAAAESGTIVTIGDGRLIERPLPNGLEPNAFSAADETDETIDFLAQPDITASTGIGAVGEPSAGRFVVVTLER